MFFSILFTVVGLSLFEAVSSVDNAIINAEVLDKMSRRAKFWFLTWGMFAAVILVRGILPFAIVWVFNPSLTVTQILSAAWSSDPLVLESVHKSAPILLIGGGVFLIFLFLHWLFLEEKKLGLPRTEKFFLSQGVWFYAAVSLILAFITWFALREGSLVGFGTVVGSSLFFIIHGFKQNAEAGERKLMKTGRSDVSRFLFLEIIDATFSIDGVLGAFAFTLSVPLILVGNGFGAFLVRRLTVRNIENIKKYIYLKNGAMYSILVLGTIMLFQSFGFHIPEYVSPLATFAIVGFFFWKSKRALA